MSPYVDALPSLVTTMRRSITAAPAPLRSIGRPHPAFDIAMNGGFLLLMAMVFFVVALRDSAVLGWGGIAFILVLFATDFRLALLRIDFDDDALRLRYRLGRRVIARAEVLAFDLKVAANDIHVVARLRDEQVKLAIAGIDPFLILETARGAWPELVA